MKPNLRSCTGVVLLLPTKYLAIWYTKQGILVMPPWRSLQAGTHIAIQAPFCLETWTGNSRNVSVSDIFSEGSAIADTSAQTRHKVAASESKAIYKATQIRGVSSQICTESLSQWCEQCESGRSKHRLLLWISTGAPNRVM